ncbi:MAG: hypothetical protein JHC95_17170 [Solirubrobacteraceae bacterium]|nr:hypothetical protein [Solirubrobacteraceae bacterium]
MTTGIVDPERLGGLEWTRRTRGVLSGRERRRLLGEVVRGQAAYVAGRVRLTTGRVPEGARELAVADLRPPDSRFARAAEEACREQTPGVIGHSYRTWVFGSGLAALDREPLDPEQFYVACLLHDHGITHTVPGEDFTLRSAERALRCARDAGVDHGTADAIADAITVHATPGIAPAADGALGSYVQAGAMYDLAALRAGDLPRGYRDDAIRAHPRAGITAEITQAIAAEARANPGTRFHLLHRCGLTLLVRAAPFRPR